MEQIVKSVVIKFAGDSGDGMQLTGTQFTNNTALLGLDIGTFPDFPAEIRAPQGTVAGVSGFQLRFSSDHVHTPGDDLDVLVAMNAAALKSNLNQLKKGGILIVNTDGFDDKNLRLAGYAEGINPLEDERLKNFSLVTINVTKLTREALQDFKLTTKEKDRAKNMFVLGFLYWIYHRHLESTVAYIEDKFANNDVLKESNIKALNAGYYYAETIEIFQHRFMVEQSEVLNKGTYRSITGNKAIAYGFTAAADINQLRLFLGSYPITPASDILHELSALKHFGVMTFQAEDEIAAISSAIGASYGGCIGLTTTSGPGMALKTEAIGFAVMLEIPLVIVNVQRAGPSTGMPTKTEQADLLQAYYGRNGECPVPILAAATPADCFAVAYEAVRIAFEHTTPVIILTDGYLANGSEPWRIPDVHQELKRINFSFKKQLNEGEEKYFPYQRNENLSRPIVLPGTPNLEYRFGGIEKQDITGNVSYDAENHQKMVLLREAKVNKINEYIPLQDIETGLPHADVLILGWGSTFGVIKETTTALIENGYSVAQIHLRYIRPFPKNLGALLQQYKKIIVPEINNGQLVKIIREQFLVNAVGFNKIKGTPITQAELTAFILQEVANLKVS